MSEGREYYICKTGVTWKTENRGLLIRMEVTTLLLESGVMFIRDDEKFGDEESQNSLHHQRRPD
ncbi:hypothetical protein J6590_016716 [Homalodisca vitripennis]|nr:hypothetical protein J6590_016716 [Homalodisca vitripennis]